MRESEAWRILAEEHDAGRTWSEFLCCNLEAVWRTDGLSAIPRDRRYAMITRINESLNDGYCAAYNNTEKTDPDVRPARVLACLMFSEQCKDEERGK